MECVISGPVLETCLLDIRVILDRQDAETLKKVIFLDLEGFYSFVEKKRGLLKSGSGKNFKELIETIEPFIPLVLSDDNLELYLLTALEQDSGELAQLERKFVLDSKIKFIKNLLSARSEEEWENIFRICRTIREYKERALCVTK